MAPFPETEIMTLKRLEVALKKGDFKLLKDGTYKLHEKYHSGFEFEYTDLLQDILYNANNSNAPSDIKDILIPTLEDILSTTNENAPVTSPYESLKPNRVSSLTSLEYTKNQTSEENTDGEKLSAFDVFSAEKTDISDVQHEQKNYIEENNQSTITTGFSEFKVPNINPSDIDEPIKEETNEIQEHTGVELIENTETEKRTKIISIFYAQSNSADKNKNIAKYKEMVSKIQDEKIDFSELIKLISEINTQSNANVVELASILEQIQNRNIKINLITNSTNANVAALVENIKIPYKFNSTEEKINIIPLFGLTNMFKCTQCNEEYIDLKDNITPYVLQCPKCKSPMLPNFSCIDTKINLELYNNALINLANSDSWLILSPSAAESCMFDVMKSAITLSPIVKEIFICDKDINARETYKNAFIGLNKDLKINVDINAMEEFLKSV